MFGDVLRRNAHQTVSEWIHQRAGQAVDQGRVPHFLSEAPGLEVVRRATHHFGAASQSNLRITQHDTLGC